jgi:hypothetical protein
MGGVTPVLVAIPWRDRGDRERTRALDFVRGHLKTITGVEPVITDGMGERFSLSAARNAAVERAKAAGVKVIVICDADTLVEPQAMHSAIEIAAIQDRVILPFTLYRALGPNESQAVMNGRDPARMTDIGSLTWSVGGVFVCRPKSWDALGGQDERFTGWGCEDTAFNLVADRLDRSHVRVKGTIHHLWHPHPETRDPEHAEYKANAALLAQYTEAENMRSFIRDRI